MESLLNLSGRKKDAAKTPKRTFPETPTKQTANENGFSSPLSETETDTVRKRRGFRPLSVVTQSIFDPFDPETMKAIAATETKLQDSKASDDKNEDDTDCDNSASQPKSLGQLPVANDSELSLKTALYRTSPDKHDVADEIEADYSTLYQQPPPDPTQHPAFLTNPFDSVSDAPDLRTKSTAGEIRKFISSMKGLPASFSTTTLETTHVGVPISHARGIEDTQDKNDEKGRAKKGLFSLELRRTPDKTQKRVSTTTVSDSPSSSRQYQYIDVPGYTSTSDQAEPASTSSSNRKLSDIFRSRPSSEKALSPAESSLLPSPVSERDDMEQYLRTVTYSPTFPYTQSSWFPRHPNTSRSWKSRNLKCTTCVDVACACYGRACCAYKAAVMALETHKDNPEGRQEAATKIQQITMVFPYGKEAPTFLQCSGGCIGEGGCGKLVCPDCCGVCPNEACSDIQCKRCKDDPWGQCKWHDDIEKTLYNMKKALSMLRGNEDRVRNTL